MTDISAPAPPSGFWADVRAAIRGTHHDYTEGSIGRAVLLLSVPMVLEMVMESVFAVVDVFFVSKLGADAVATVGLTESMLALVYTMAMGLAIGVTATVARRIGERDPEAAARTAVQGIALGIGAAIVLAVAGVTLAPHLLRLMGASPGVVATGSGYTRVMLGGNVVILLLFLINAVFRGAGDAAISLRVLWVANLLNIVLAPSFIFGVGPLPELGVTGAAVGTTIGRGVGVLLQFWYLTRPGRRVQVERRHVVLDPALMWRLVRLSATGTFQVLVGTASWIGLIRVISTFGSAAVAGYTIGIRVILFALLPSWGLSNAAATMVGQALGAGKPDRAARAVRIAGTYAGAFLSLVGIVFVVLAPQIVRLFTQDPEVAPIAAACLRIVALGFPFYGFGMVFTQSFNGAGDTWTPTLLNLVCFWLFEIPVAWFLAQRAGLGARGGFIAIAVAFSLLAVLAGVLFRKGRWRTKVV